MSPTTPNNVAPKDTTVDKTVDNTTQSSVDTVQAVTEGATQAPANNAEVPTETAMETAVEAPVQGEAETVVVIVHNGPTGNSTTNNTIRPVIVQHPPTVAFGEGTGYTMSTDPENFDDWVDYTLYCEEGPTIRVLCAKEIVDNCCVSFSGLNVSQKLFVDHSAYFTALLTGPWKEASSRILRLPEIRIEDFKRLHLTLLAGGAAPRNNIGKPTTVIANLVETYILADYFDMPAVQTWLKASLGDYLNEMRSWSSLYVNQILDEAGGSAAEQMHMEKVKDFGSAYLRMKKLNAQQQIMPHDELIRFLVGHCPRPLMASVISSLGQQFKDAVFSEYLLL